MRFQPYGCMIVVGLLISGIAARSLSRQFCVNFYDILLLYAYGLSFGMCGAKLLYLIINIQSIPWRTMNVSAWVDYLGSGGFVFYGGLILGYLGILLAARLHTIELCSCLRICIPLLPLVHGFGRIGCSFAGCCYGIAYNGPFSITYINSAIAPCNTGLFPVQPLEAVLLFLLAAVLLYFLLRGMHLGGLMIMYVSIYAVCRFLLEYLRGDIMRGRFFGLSTSQWLSIFALLAIPVGLVLFVNRRKIARKTV